MEILNMDSDLRKYLLFGGLVTPFLDEKIIDDKVMCDFNAKLKQGKNASKIESLFMWINNKVEFTNDEELSKKYKFRRTAQEIWQSGFSTGCTDYAILFTCFARQLGYPTTILRTIDIKWANKVKNNETPKQAIGHSFCEVFIDNKWILVDPTNQKIIEEYNPNEIRINYSINKSSEYIAFSRNINLEPQRVSEHIKEMEDFCKEL